ncbi:DeoR/GlpR transcriptional regulator [Rhizobium leguminosarum]|uniref:DeoR/GlpR family DNA-binding transcription regulator n=1 Tax=Rhizobium leguminosarum TaxID=384 RepID=UPI001C98BD76|nr:DeoR/GlpR family DNA-binding transcription regulator [Rhizobium leguminosarum]MBY5720912.1 DeoR/GlpR transcriptional regulator [Rhizobium leguminosarum]
MAWRDDQSEPKRTGGASLGAVRQQSIRSLVDQGHVIAIADIAKRFSVSNETIRRDIRALEEAGQLRRVHGGAAPARTFDLTARRPLVERMEVDRDGKVAAARAAMALLQDDMNVFIGVSSTMSLVAEELARSDKRLSVTTNSIDIALVVAASGRCVVNLLGGIVHFQKRSLDGYEVLANLEGRLFDLALMGASGVSAAHGVLAPTKEHELLVRAAADRSEQVAFVVDSAKFNRRDAQVVQRFDEVDFLATDIAPPSDLATALEEAGVAVFLPPSDAGVTEVGSEQGVTK